RFSSPADAVSISRGAKGSTSPRDRTSTTTHAFRSSHFRRFWPAAGDYAARPEASGASWRHSETVGHRATLRFGPRSSVDRAAVSPTDRNVVRGIGVFVRDRARAHPALASRAFWPLWPKRFY